MRDAIIRETCHLRLGSRVTVSPNAKYAADWTGEYVVVGLALNYQTERVALGSGEPINITIASDEDIRAELGATDGWKLDDLILVQTPSNT